MKLYLLYPISRKDAMGQRYWCIQIVVFLSGCGRWGHRPRWPDTAHGKLILLY